MTLKLKVRSLSSEKTRSISDEKFYTICSINIRRKITQVHIEEMDNIQDFYSIWRIWPRMKYLQLNCLNNMNIPLFLRTILKDINDSGNSYLRSLCLQLAAVDDQMTNNLKQMIECDKLLLQFTIKRIMDNVYLQWT
ncbi:unnamed protein product [Rotaria magnacalcarata]|uniref:Uncharacterized protein n=1 Tax=Rotaria magnacalcarata TaxID=392030 RepID=A0A820DE03_9BILA|nr:unnamed protein product [Rotaria magnacalcarata]CAF1575733.1 unnamed protein product [Rotaria magnacalcarata]CAF2124231.1 unnamed protein product [Rotaria magnacalcarata]CAF2145173.1 unnamed protein product [Rotaria magnacalcarata]CAF2155934.1 unnamed protein product [Rotaria magnacalcarata]